MASFHHLHASVLGGGLIQGDPDAHDRSRLGEIEVGPVLMPRFLPSAGRLDQRHVLIELGLASQKPAHHPDERRILRQVLEGRVLLPGEAHELADETHPGCRLK